MVYYVAVYGHFYLFQEKKSEPDITEDVFRVDEGDGESRHSVNVLFPLAVTDLEAQLHKKIYSALHVAQQYAHVNGVLRVYEGFLSSHVGESPIPLHFLQSVHRLFTSRLKSSKSVSAMRLF